jgi:hypothetical protein
MDVSRMASEGMPGGSTATAPGWRFYVPAAVVGLLLRVAMLVLIVHRVDAGDEVAYEHMGWNLAAHGTYSLDLDAPLAPTAVRAPLLPFVIAASYEVFGRHQLPVQIIQILVTVLGCCLLAAAVGRLEPQLSKYVLWLTLLSPSDALYTGAFLAEALCTSCLIVAASAPLLMRRGRFLVAGAALGAAALARDIYLLAAPFAAGVCLGFGLLRRRALAPLVRGSAALLLGALLLVLPWTARNLHAFHQPIPVTKGLLWYNLWIGTWERNGDWEAVTLARHLPEEAYRDARERERITAALAEENVNVREAAFRSLTVDRLQSEPATVVARWVRRAPRMWLGTRFDLFTFRPASLAPRRPLWILFKSALFGLNSLVLLSALGGLIYTVRNRKPLLWFALPIAYDIAIYFPFHNIESRFSQPVYPFVLIFAAAALWRVIALVRSRRPVLPSPGRQPGRSPGAPRNLLANGPQTQ